jgi:hypothetical protein
MWWMVFFLSSFPDVAGDAIKEVPVFVARFALRHVIVHAERAVVRVAVRSVAGVTVKFDVKFAKRVTVRAARVAVENRVVCFGIAATQHIRKRDHTPV